MAKKLTRTLAGVMSLMFVGQIMVLVTVHLKAFCTRILSLLQQKQLKA